MKLISACLCGINCKYNGKNNVNPVFVKMLKNHKVLPVCPEQLGGLATPRDASEILTGTGAAVLQNNARVVDENGKDLSDNFIRGAEETLLIAQTCGINEAILKSRSPSCGIGKIYDGSFSSTIVKGDGVTAALLKQHGIKVISDDEYLARAGEL